MRLAKIFESDRVRAIAGSSPAYRREVRNALPSVLRGSAFIFLLMLCVLPAHAQTGYTIVSATVKDPFGFPYSGNFPGGGTVSATIVPVGTTNLKLNGNSISGQIQTAALDQNAPFRACVSR